MIITISRQFMAGGSDVARRVADALGWTVVDDALIDAIAERSGFTPEEVESLEESVPTFLEKFGIFSALSSPESVMAAPNVIEGSAAEQLAHVSRQLIEELGTQDRIVLVGRAAAAILESKRDALHVRLVGSLAYRVKLAMDRFGLDETKARTMVEERDSRRQRYHSELFGRDWNDPVNYHLVLNTEVMGAAMAADLIVASARAMGW
jgi:cytidylate kinase